MGTMKTHFAMAFKVSLMRIITHWHGYNYGDQQTFLPLFNKQRLIPRSCGCVFHSTRVAARSHEQFQEGVVGEYHILCIITDGVITDMADTKSAIVSASNLPLSIVIVGVGAADFGRMDELDSDGVVLTDVNGMKAARDMVQFVQFRNYGNNSAELAAAVLEEIPNQVEEYCGMFKVVPRQ
eukprot:m.88300 g.88300  ORF g.88300 m.88300 type:complete len:181 (+) comp8805_c0_seq1:1106-1648(+)